MDNPTRRIGSKRAKKLKRKEVPRQFSVDELREIIREEKDAFRRQCNSQHDVDYVGNHDLGLIKDGLAYAGLGISDIGVSEELWAQVERNQEITWCRWLVSYIKDLYSRKESNRGEVNELRELVSKLGIKLEDVGMTERKLVLLTVTTRTQGFDPTMIVDEVKEKRQGVLSSIPKPFPRLEEKCAE